MNSAIERILPAILRTPTPENSQPWEIVVRDNRLEIYHSSARAKLATFPDDLSVFNIGLLSEAITLAASTEGLTPSLTYLLESRGDKQPWLRAELEYTACAADPLASALTLRHADRRRYAGGSLADPVFQELKAEAAAVEGSQLYFTDFYPADYQQQIAAADQATMCWSEMRRDLFLWLRFTERAIRDTQDGIPWHALLRNPETWRHYLQSRLWWLEMRLDWFPDWLLRIEKRLFDDSGDLTPTTFADGAGIGCITTASGSSADLVTAGRLALRVWLLLNLRGYSVQPMTNLTSIVYPQQVWNWQMPNGLASAVIHGYAILQRTFGFPAQEIPIFCFRTGLPIAPYPSNARTLRRPDRVRWAATPQGAGQTRMEEAATVKH